MTWHRWREPLGQGITVVEAKHHLIIAQSPRQIELDDLAAEPFDDLRHQAANREPGHRTELDDLLLIFREAPESPNAGDRVLIRSHEAERITRRHSSEYSRIAVVVGIDGQPNAEAQPTLIEADRS